MTTKQELQSGIRNLYLQSDNLSDAASRLPKSATRDSMVERFWLAFNKMSHNIELMDMLYPHSCWYGLTNKTCPGCVCDICPCIQKGGY